MAALLAGVGGVSQASTPAPVHSFDDPADAYQPEADVRSWRVSYGQDALSIGVTVTTGAQPSSLAWSHRHLSSISYIDTTGDGVHEWELWLSSLWSDLYWSLWPAGQRKTDWPSSVPTCQDKAVWGGNSYEMVVPTTASCLGTPAAVRVRSTFSYDDGTGESCRTCGDDHYPDTGDSGSIARAGGTATTSSTSSSTTTSAPPPHTSPTTATPSQAQSSSRSGYWMVSQHGHVYAFGDAGHHGSPSPIVPSEVTVDIETVGDGRGYWTVSNQGRVNAFGSASHHGDLWRTVFPIDERVTSMSARPDGHGYWLFTNKGRVAAFGLAGHHGDMAGKPLNGPVLGSVATPSGKGYYMVASDGGIFSFGDAAFAGSMGGHRLNKPVTGLVPDGDGRGYWLVASDGGVFAFDAPFRGSMGGTRLNQPVNGMVRFGDGYLMIASDGGVFNFSNKPFYGSLGGKQVPAPIVGAAAFGT